MCAARPRYSSYAIALFACRPLSNVSTLKGMAMDMGMDSDHARGGELIRRAVQCGRRNALEGGILCLIEGLSLIDERSDPRLALGALHNLSLFLAHQDLTVLARAVLARAKPLYRQVNDPLMNARLLWLEGTISRLGGRYTLAARQLERATDAFRSLRADWQSEQVKQEFVDVLSQLQHNEAA